MCRGTNKKEIKMAKNGCYGGGSYGWVGNDGCCVAAFLIIGSLTLAGCGISKLLNKQQPTNTNTQTSRRGGISITKNDNPTPQDVIAYNCKAKTL